MILLSTYPATVSTWLQLFQIRKRNCWQMKGVLVRCFRKPLLITKKLTDIGIASVFAPEIKLQSPELGGEDCEGIARVKWMLLFGGLSGHVWVMKDDNLLCLYNLNKIKTIGEAYIHLESKHNLRPCNRI